MSIKTCPGTASQTVPSVFCPKETVQEINVRINIKNFLKLLFINCFIFCLLRIVKLKHLSDYTVQKIYSKRHLSRKLFSDYEKRRPEIRMFALFDKILLSFS